MKTQPQVLLRPNKTLPTHSVDWRFLLPISDNSRILVICNKQSDYDHSFRELKMLVQFTLMDELGELLNESDSFDVVAMPFGTNKNIYRLSRINKWASKLSIIRDLIRPGGTLMVGFSNRMNLHRRINSLHTSSIWEMSHVLRRLNYQEIKFYGAIPEPLAPEFIFPLSTQVLGFILNHRYQHKLPKPILRLVHKPAASWILNLLPFYYAVAKVGS